MSGNAKKVVGVDRERQPYRTELTPVSFLRRSAYVFPDQIAVVHGARRYTYREFEERANRLASRLRALGLRHLDRVAILAPNMPAMLEAHFGVPAAGLDPRPHQHPARARTRSATSCEHSGREGPLRRPGVRAHGEAARLPAGLRVVRIDDTGAAGDPYEDFLAAGSPEPVRALARGRVRDDLDQLHLGDDRPPEGRDGPPPRRLPERHRRGPRDRPLVRRAGTSGPCRCSTATAGASRGA